MNEIETVEKNLERILCNARAELKEKGRIDFISQKRIASTYKMIPFQFKIGLTKDTSLSEEKVLHCQTEEKICGSFCQRAFRKCS